ncbi:class I SAM-dependent methyltransferase [Pseudodesulfovibrio tunisiensis]|uniref:class I SAM-dependent methyltransferase n=1 Tax=Pseudodesulfovibrio tunisiensis TaxID=463192 RepID=UPI001FB3D996|nr:protein N-lysine methyltransferase family protein [Pseudodesulfovibrio tunisiensis]
MKYDLGQPFEALMDLARKKFGEVRFEPFHFGGGELEVLQIVDMPKYIDKLVSRTRSGKSVDLPLWAKIWPSCMVLGAMLDKYPFPENAKVIEIGAGCAVNGLLLARRGLDVVVTDVDEDALLFSRINALKNGLDNKLTVRRVDFTRDSLGERFDYILGCEVVYTEAAYEPLVGFLDDHLASAGAGEVFLALDGKRQARRFFQLASDRFAMMRTAANIKDKGESREVLLFRLRRK